MKIFSIFFYLLFTVVKTNGKYVEGHIKTLEDWVFVSRFCFLSEEGRYEYFIEFDRKYGDIQLLLYYDEPHQWHSVYKTSKTCQEKVSVLSPNDNQIVTLSAKAPYFIKSGCGLRTMSSSPRSENKDSTATTKSTKKFPEDSDSTYFDQFLKTTTQIPQSTSSPFSSFDVSSTTFGLENFTDVDIEDFNMTNTGYKTMVFDQETQDNNLENSTDFKIDVEEMFEDSDGQNRTKRQTFPRIFENEKKQTIFVSCHNAGGFTSARQRWWYIALANCGSNKGMDVRFKFRMTNGALGDFWHEHFSADEMFIPPVILAEVIAYTFLLLAIFACGIELKTRHLYHCTYRLYTLSAVLHWSGVLLNSVTWAKYAVSGIGPFTIFGGLFTGAGEIAFLLLMLLMAKGYTITRARLSTASTVKITVFINLYIVVYISLYIYQSEAFDPGDVLNLYESAAGYALAALRCFAWAFFLIACTTTIKKFPEKRYFYFPFGIIGSIWILSGPILIFMIIGLLDPWVRESLVFMVYALFAFIGHAYFLWLTWPSRANKSFPYHVKTNHIGIASNDDDGADYPRHTYEPAPPDATIIIPLSRRTEEFVTSGGLYNPGFVRDVDYFRAQPLGPMSMPQQCFPSKNVHRRLPSPTNDAPPALINGRLYGTDTLNDDDDEDSIRSNVETESGITKRSSTETMEKQLSSLDSVDGQEAPPGVRNDFPSRHSSQDNDSGHLSLTASVSPNSNETSTTPTDGSLQQQESLEKPMSPPSLAPILKDNPFKIHTKAPNKIILDPIQLPNIHQNGTVTSSTAALSNVPRHLFAVKKSGQ